jgi:regulatory protein
MDREERGESFSSQSVKLEVTDIRRGVSGEAVQFSFSDGSSFFIHPEAAREFSVRQGAEFTSEEINTILTRSAEFAARDKAVDYLSRRDHSAFELILKLRKKDYDKETAVAAVDMLKARGYVDDRRFTGLWIESRLKKHPEGRSRLLAGLARKGISRDIAESVLGEIFSEEQQEEALERCMEKYLRARPADSGKLIRHLLSRGFGYGEIKRRMAEMESGDYE